MCPAEHLPGTPEPRFDPQYYRKVGVVTYAYNARIQEDCKIKIVLSYMLSLRPG